jgi:hypothetical protein
METADAPPGKTKPFLHKTGRLFYNAGDKKCNYKGSEKQEQLCQKQIKDQQHQNYLQYRFYHFFMSLIKPSHNLLLANPYRINKNNAYFYRLC